MSNDHMTAYDLLVEKFGDIYNKSPTKIKLKRSNSANPWIDNEIIEVCQLKCKLLKKGHANPQNYLAKERFRQIRIKMTDKKKGWLEIIIS